MIDYLRGVTDDVAKSDVVHRIGDLAERYAPDTQWFIDTMNQVHRLRQVRMCQVCTCGGSAEVQVDLTLRWLRRYSTPHRGSSGRNATRVSRTTPGAVW